MNIRIGEPDAEPRLALGWAAWASMNLTDGFSKKLREAHDLGFETIEMSMDPVFAEFTRSLRDEFGFTIIGQGASLDAPGCKPIIDAAAQVGAAALNLHLGHAFVSASHGAAMLEEVYALAADAGVLVMVETHRGRFTQDPLRTRELVELFPDVRFNLDVSHWWLANEGEGNAPDAWAALLDPILERTVMAHGRVSDGQMIQADIGADGSADACGPFVEIWARAMSAWLGAAKAGDVFVFTPELGPAPYSYHGPDGTELIDRWSRSLAMADLGRRAWDRAATTINA